jgi:hypothetical protein
MHKVQCDGCRNEVEVALYFYDKRIITHEENALNNATYWEAMCRGEAICPICGCNIEKLFKKTISGKNIVDLAVGE